MIAYNEHSNRKGIRDRFMRKRRAEKGKKMRNAVLILLCVVTAMICRQIRPKDAWLWVLVQLPRAYLYMTLYCIWGISLHRRLINQTSRRYLCSIAVLMVFWFFVRSLKYYVFYAPVALRYGWYCYYIPMFMIPALSFMTAMTMGKAESEKQSRQITGILTVTGCLVLFVLTNDLHQLVFRFPKGQPWTDFTYSYGPGFVLCMIWVTVGLIGTLILLLKKCKNPGKKMVWLPFVPMALFFVWCIANMLHLPVLKVIAGDMTAASCLLIAAVFEACIQCGLIPVNSRYAELFQASKGINAKICDQNLTIRYASRDGMLLEKESMEAAKKQPVMIQPGIRLNSIPVNGGYAFWTEDVRKLVAVYDNLQDVQEELQDRNRLLKLEYKKEKQKKQVEEKNRLYDLMQNQTIEQFQLISGYMDELEQCKEQKQYRGILGKILLVGTYLKRRKTLTLSAMEKENIGQEELLQSLKESCDCLALCGIWGRYYVETEPEKLTAAMILLTYDFFEQMTELLLEKGGTFFYRLTRIEGQLRISVHLQGTCSLGRLAEKYPQLVIEQEDRQEWFLSMPLAVNGGTDENL